MTDTPPAMQRPEAACLTCQPPAQGRAWRLAHSGYRTCDACLDRMRLQLREIIERFLKLNPTPGANADHGSRGAPGFGSRAPASEHIIAMRDRRSKSYEVAYDGVVYEDWHLADPDDEEAWSRPLPKGVEGPVELPGKYTRAREVWFAADGRGHEEQHRPPRSVHHVLDSLATMVAEERGVTPPFGTVPDLARWLDRNLDFVTRCDWVADFADELHQLTAQLKPVTGDKRRRIGFCPNTLDDGKTTKECGHPLYAPTENARDDTIRCGGCRREWPKSEWLRLMDMLDSA